ncbi:unnamed protein product [Linum tenue]|uniref:Uncharacterized protein n=1 Tax=Linum tenue TaxID=586396 RepID=A0AAV0MBG5_9ROSI|nr:unnamed protein product [Linum tenue]
MVGTSGIDHALRAGPQDRARELVLVQIPDHAGVLGTRGVVRRPRQRWRRPDRRQRAIVVRGVQQAAARPDGVVAGKRAGDDRYHHYCIVLTYLN